MLSTTYVVLGLVWGCALGHVMPWTPGNCLSPPLKREFRPDKFFRDRWYNLRSSGDYLLEGHGSCAASQSRVDSSGRIDLINYHYLTLLGKYSYVRGHTDTTEFSDGSSNYTVTYEALFGLADVKIPFGVVATDYVNYAVLYSCKQILGFKSEMSWILTRKRGSNQFNKDIKSAVERAGLRYTSYLPEFNSGCGPNEPRL